MIVEKCPFVLKSACGGGAHAGGTCTAPHVHFRARVLWALGPEKISHHWPMGSSDLDVTASPFRLCFILFLQG